MGDRLLRAVEKWLLPWFDRAADERAERRAAVAVTIEQRKAKETEQVRLRSIGARIRAERVIEEYRVASVAVTAAGNRLVDETRRAGRER